MPLYCAFCSNHSSAGRVVLILHTSFVAVGAIFDVAVWYYIKDVKIFDEEIELHSVKGNEDAVQEKLITPKGNNS
ncbi:hypothetical protein PR048_019175 [Dryococelus australis]|uniref:Uncharacterized protein n=1 Tax=Dryococelus australis TaxID=614101 RepID=A0ABQ9H2R4_9NEOP|nr:hypothetical protein PR048_019175 [Dryococelus australis]